jgi:hypothetical protein
MRTEEKRLLRRGLMARLFGLLRFTAILGVFLILVGAAVIVNYELEQRTGGLISPAYYFLPVSCFLIGIIFLTGGIFGMWILHRKNRERSA